MRQEAEGGNHRYPSMSIRRTREAMLYVRARHPRAKPTHTYVLGSAKPIRAPSLSARQAHHGWQPTANERTTAGSHGVKGCLRDGSA